MSKDKRRPPSHLEEDVRKISERLFELIKTDSREIGWCILSHGSMVRDLDIVAIPWIEEAVDVDTLVKQIQQTISTALNGACYRGIPTDKPHHRKAYLFYVNSDELVETPNGAFPFIDLSVMDFRIGVTPEEKVS